MAKKATLIIKVHMNRDSGQRSRQQVWQRAGAQFSAAVVSQVALEVTRERFRALAAVVRKEIERDVQREIDNIAWLYSRHAIGRAGVRNRTFGIKARTTDTMGRINFGRWARLSPDTIRQKGHSSFFLNRGDLGLEMRNPKKWTASFGPIRVELKQTHSGLTGLEPERVYKSDAAGGSTSTFSYARITVFAMGKITSAMIPELADQSFDGTRGFPRTGQDNYSRRGGLAAMMPDDVKFKIGGWSRTGTGHYRPSLEPFLAFALTRSIPAAVHRRLMQK